MPPRNAAPSVHCLRISKTGSTTLKSLIQDNNIRQDLGGRKLILHGHFTHLPEVVQNPTNQVVFFLREPLARFVSGFNSRVIDAPNTRHATRREKETSVLERFATANDLAEALTSSEEQTVDRAYYAMETLLHAKLHYTDWLVDLDYLKSRMHRVMFVGFMETFAQDVQRFFNLLGIERTIDLPHERRAPDTAPRALSDKAEANLRKWYADDIEIYEWVLSQRERWAGDAPAATAG